MAWQQVYDPMGKMIDAQSIVVVGQPPGGDGQFVGPGSCVVYERDGQLFDEGRGDVGRDPLPDEEVHDQAVEERAEEVLVVQRHRRLQAEERMGGG